MQEFRYDSVAHTITATSPLLTSQDARSTDPAANLMAAGIVAYAPDGTLFVGQVHPNSLLAAPLAVFAPGSLGSRPTRDAPFGRVATPDLSIAAFDAYGANSPGSTKPDYGSPFSLDYDPAHQELIVVSAGGAVLRAVRWGTRSWANGVPPPIDTAALCQVDLGGAALAAASPGNRFQARQGVIDPKRHVLFVPYQGLPTATPTKVLQSVPQYLFGVDLDRLGSSCS
jgi:hypothetical protein